MSRHPFRWPSDLWQEARYMGQTLYLSEVFDALVKVARLEIVEGLAVDDSTGKLFLRQMTAEQAVRVIQENQDILEDDRKFPYNVEDVLKKLNAVIDLNPGAKSLVGWDDDDPQQFSLSYVITKDDNGKRVTLVWRSEEAKDATGFAEGNVLSQFDVAKDTVVLPPSKSSNTPESIQVHRGFYRYLFGMQPEGKTSSGSGHSNNKMSKFDQMWATLKPILQAYPKYKLYVTGMGVSGALAQISAFFLASDASTPKPVSCLTMGAPRVGDNEPFLRAAQALEQQRFLRACRFVMPNDLTPCTPSWGFGHVGFQIKFLGHPHRNHPQDIELTYPKVLDKCGNRFSRAWNNMGPWIPQTKVSLDDYVNALESSKDAIEDVDLNDIYSDTKFTGYLIAPLPVEK